MTIAPSVVLSPKEAARLLEISPNAARKAIRRGALTLDEGAVVALRDADAQPNWLVKDRERRRRSMQLAATASERNARKAKRQAASKPVSPAAPAAPPRRRTAVSQPVDGQKRSPKGMAEIDEIANTLAVSKAAARDVAVHLNGRSGEPRIGRRKLAELAELDASERAAYVASAREQAPGLRERTKQRRVQRALQERAERDRRAEEARRERDRVDAIKQRRRAAGIEDAYGDPSLVRSAAAAEFLGVSPAQLRRLLDRQHLSHRKIRVRSSHGKADRVFLSLDELLRAAADPPAWLTDARDRASKQQAAEQQRAREKARVWAAEERARRDAQERAHAMVQIRVPQRRAQPETVVAHLGPTNSGKTHHAIEQLVAAGQGVYAAPLRFLARETYERLADRLGDDQVGLRTGEERINDTAPILCATTEMAPDSGLLLALDEAHWAADPDRGTAWTRLLAAGDYQHFHLAGSPDVLPLLRSAFGDALQVRSYERLGPLTMRGHVKIGALQPGTAVVAFSRKAVLGLAGELRRRGVKVATLYGAMPVDARLEQLERFATGAADVLCTTDVIGHGVNVPTLRTVVFAETEKFDGVTRRNLEPWEVAQIAGRAGRYGHTGEGHVAALSGVSWANPSTKVISAGLRTKVKLDGGLVGFRRVTHGRLGPKLADLGCDTALQLPFALAAWVARARSELDRRWVRVDECEAQTHWLNVMDQTGMLGSLQVHDAWRLANAPVDPDKDGPLFDAMLRDLTASGSRSRLASFLDVDAVTLEEAEQAARDAAAIRWYALAFPGRSSVTVERAAQAERDASAMAAELLDRELRANQIGRCASCGKQCPPWFRHCDPCHRSRGGRWHDDWDDDW